MNRLATVLIILSANCAPAEDFTGMRGANYVPSYARNDVQIWMDYDPVVIDRELGYAARLKLNTVRVFLQAAVYEREPRLFLARFEDFLRLCEKHHLRMMPVVFDSCFGEFPDLVNYKDKNWMANPGQNRLGREHWPKWEQYVRGVVGGHKDDPRIVMWDVMNEPTCTSFNKPEDKELIWMFLRHFLDYVKQVDPNHPRTVGVEHSSLIPQVLDKIEVIATHNYRNDLREDLRAVKALGRKHGKPVIINEVAGRPKQPYSYVMPILAEEKVGWCFWELMIGRTQFSQGIHPYQGVIYPDGTCYDAAEVMYIAYPGDAGRPGLHARQAATALWLPQRPRPQPGPGEIADTDPSMKYSDGWTLWTGSGPRLGTLHYHNAAGGRMDLSFEGTGVSLVHKIGPDCGLAHVLLDAKPATQQHAGMLKADDSGNAALDTYGPSVDWNRRVPIARGLAPGKHTLTIIVTGKKNAASSNCYVQIVGADVEAAPRPPIPSVKALADQVSCSVDYFDVAGHSAFLIRPKGKTNSTPMPWVWYAPVIGHPNPTHAWMLRQWLDKGIAMAGVDVGESFGSPAGRKVFSALWETLTSRYGMSKQPCLLPQSRGGLMLYNWAAENPSRVGCIAGIYTVCDLRSYPGVDKACGAYGLSAAELEARLAQHNPIDRLAPLAKAGVPIFHVHGDSDQLVPLEKNAGELARRFRALGGQARLIVIPGKGHQVCDEFFHCQELVDFVIAHIRSEARPTAEPRK